MEATKARGELTDNPLEYYQYIRQLNQQVCVVKVFYILTLTCFKLYILYIYPR